MDDAKGKQSIHSRQVCVKDYFYGFCSFLTNVSRQTGDPLARGTYMSRNELEFRRRIHEHRRLPPDAAARKKE
uniref:Uncharacterized protein n=1 Tax=Hyaloperonospora arabidopsidis (strain Emoy2) TaxID=559515 RepID=M4C3F6_HYAAE